MARQQRNNVDYFPHSVNHGKKMFFLRDKYGNDGYAVWFMLLEELGKADNHYMDLKDEIQLMYLSSQFKVTEEVLKEIIGFLVKFGEFDKDLWNDESILFNYKFNENISDAYKKRKNDIINLTSLKELLYAENRLTKPKGLPNRPLGNPKGDGNPQRIVEEIKEEEIKEEDILGDEPPPPDPKFKFKKYLLDYGFDQQLVDDWLEVRKKKKAANTLTAYTPFINSIEKCCANHSHKKNDVFRVVVEKGWQGLKPLWYDNEMIEISKGNPDAPKPIQRMTTSAAHLLKPNQQKS